jgi:predicted TPR repeat methyltransferase
MIRLAEMRKKAGDLVSAEELYERAVEAGESTALIFLAEMRKKAGDLPGTENLYWRLDNAGHTWALIRLAAMREKAGDPAGAGVVRRLLAACGEAALTSVPALGWEPDGSESTPW